jgi:hypothetical protein
VWTWFGSPFPLPGFIVVPDDTVTAGGGAVVTVLAGGMGAGGFATGEVVVVGGVTGGVVGGVMGGVVGGVTGGPLGVADGGLGFGRFLGCGVVDGLGSVRVVVTAGRTTTVGRTATRCG